MRAVDILVGATYLAKVSGRVVQVRVLGPGPDASGARGAGRPTWRCQSLVTGRQILVRSPQRFRARVETEGKTQ